MLALLFARVAAALGCAWAKLFSRLPAMNLFYWQAREEKNLPLLLSSLLKTQLKKFNIGF